MNIPSQDVHLVVGLEGKPTAVLVDISLRERIIQALEDAEDISLAREALIALDAAGGDPTNAGFLSWSGVKAELERMDDTEE